MCYYATTDYVCGDWKWGNMMLRCPRQHRIGETCGAKLVHHESVTKSSTVCKTCEEIGTKQRRLAKIQENILRWSRESDKFSASLEKARRESRELEEKIKELYYRRPSIATNISGPAKSAGSGRNNSTAAAATVTLPPVTSVPTATTPRYEYTTVSGMSRTHDGGHYTTPRNGGLQGVGNLSPVSRGPGSTTSSYASLPAGNVLSRNTPTINTASANVSVERQGGGYSVSYARR